MVVRGDHVGRLAEHAAFTERLGGAFALVPPLTDPELREIVREPARTVGLDVDPELLDAVVADVLGPGRARCRCCRPPWSARGNGAGATG